MTGVVMLMLAAGVPAWAQGDEALVVEGQRIYQERKCGVCHAVKGQGAKSGPDLTAVGAKREAAWLKTFMKDPKAVNPQSKMLAFKGTDEELEALAAYLASLK
jgi:nitric oxide reductase subunit C